MLYTVGDYPSNILKLIKRNKIDKVGKDENYSGGIVFESIKEAKKYLKETNYLQAKIIGLKAFQEDFYFGEDGYKYLNKNVKMFLLNKIFKKFKINDKKLQQILNRK